MNVQFAKDEMRRFLEADQAEVLSINGKWGVGKSYTWNEALRDVRARKKLGLPRYSYVSLFGLNTIEEIKIAIIEGNASWSDAEGDRDAGNVGSGLKALNNPKSFFQAMRLLPGGFGEAEALYNAFKFSAVTKQIICFDDLERRGAQLRLRDILGLTTFLKEQRQCKIVLIMNDDVFEPDDRAEYKKYYEKTIDGHILFEPSAEDCAAIALKQTGRLQAAIKKYSELLNIKNVRLIQRIERLGKMMEPALMEYSDQVFSIMIKSLVAVAWAKYATSAPSLEYLVSKTYGKSSEVSDEEKKWIASIDAYGIMYVAKQDGMIEAAVDRGFFLTEELSKFAREARKAEKQEEAAKCWSIYRRSFADNDKEFIAAVYQGAKQYASYVDAREMNLRIVTLRELGEGAKANELAEMFVSQLPDSALGNSIQREFWIGAAPDKYMVELIDARISSRQNTKSPTDILERIALSQGYNPEDKALLATLTEDDWYELFKNYEGDALSAMVKFPAFFCGDDNGNEIYRRVLVALKKIEGDSPLNAMRLKSHGIRSMKDSC